MLGERDFVPVAEGLIAGTAGDPRLVGSQCNACDTVTFPRQGSCPRCTSEDVRERLLSPRGTLWTWTVQCFPPKAPPYAAATEFEPYAVGYVELPGELRVESLLTGAWVRSGADLYIRHLDNTCDLSAKEIVNLNDNVLMDEDGNEYVTNSINGNLKCSGNVPAPQVGDSEGLPNQVNGRKSGQCAAV